MAYHKHQHLKLSELPLHPKQFLHIISMLTNGQSYPTIQKYIHKTLDTDILKSTITNLRHKVILARHLEVPITALLDGRKDHKTSSHSKDKGRVTVQDCINSLISSYYADVKSQTLTDKQRIAFINVLKLKLKYNNEIKDEALDTDILTNALETDTDWKNGLLKILFKQAHKYHEPAKELEAPVNKISNHIRAYHSLNSLNIMNRYCKRHNVWWTDDVYYQHKE